MTPLIAHILAHPTVLIQTDFLREIWMIPERLIAQDKTDAGYHITTESPVYPGKLFVYKDLFYAIDTITRTDDRHSGEATYSVTAHDTGIVYTPKEDHPLSTPQDRFTLTAGQIANYTDGPAIETNLGRFVANYLFFVYPFGTTIAYLNEEFTAPKLEKRIAERLLTDDVSVHDIKDKFVNTLTLIGQANDIICPNITEKTIVIPASIKTLRDKLVKENKALLDAGDVPTMSMIEQTLISAYKDHLKDDPSMHFLLKSKYFNVTLKKLLLTQGMTEVFGSPGTFTFIDNPMGNGWKVKDFPAINNEVRAGSYARAIETADGGVIAKLILRVFQDTRIDIADCKTTRGESVVGTKAILDDFLWNYVINADGSETLITKDNITSFVGQSLTIRTPGYCQDTKGYCARCFGHTFETLDQKAFAPVANDFARVITTSALKRMHGTSHATVDVSDLNKYLVVT